MINLVDKLPFLVTTKIFFYSIFYVICVCLCIMVSNAYCVVILFCFSSSFGPYVASFSGLSSFFIDPSVFSNVYLILIILFFHHISTVKSDLPLAYEPNLY